MSNQINNFSAFSLYLTTSIIGLITLIILANLAAHTNFWQDETLIVFVSNHSPFSIHFYQALKSMTSGMPWSFVEYWAYLNMLKLIPFTHLMEHIDLYLRLPLSLYLGITMMFSFLMVRRLSKSLILASFCTICLFTLNHLTEILGREMRFHTSPLANAAVSWCLLAYALTMTQKSAKAYTVYGLWLISAFTTGWTHIFGTYNLFSQLLVFAAASFNWIPKFSLRWLSKKIKITSFGFLTSFVFLQYYFYDTFMQKAGVRGSASEPLMRIFQNAFNTVDQQIFQPEIWLWVGGYLLFAIAVFLKSKGTAKLKISGVIFFGAAQFGCILILATAFLKMKWYDPGMMARYVTPGLIPFVFTYAYLAGHVFRPEWDRKFGYFVSIALIIMALKIADYPNAVKDETQLWSQVKTIILEESAFGKVTHVAGLRPRHDHSLQEDIHGLIVAHTWQLYTGGPFAIARIPDYKTNAYGGRVNVPCESISAYPVANRNNARNYLIDFCTQHKPVLRVYQP